VVVDNASTDKTEQNIHQFVGERFQYIRLDKNFGFAGGYHTALQQIDAEYFVLLNQDVEVTPEWLDPLVHYMDQHPELGAVQPKILAHGQKECFEYAGASGGFLDILGYPFCRGRIFNTVEEDHGQYDSPLKVGWVSGACMMIRKSIYVRSQGLDPDYFAHMEEIDLCWRIRRLGWDLAVVPQSVVYHVGGGSLAYGSPRKTELNFRNSLMMLLKNLPGSLIFPVIFFRMILDGVAGLQMLLKGEKAHFFAILTAHSGFYSQIPAVWKKRKSFLNIQPVAPASKYGVYRGSIVWEYYVLKKTTFSRLTESRWQPYKKH
jgi:GT2 family glycosyltransferase